MEQITGTTTFHVLAGQDRITRDDFRQAALSLFAPAVLAERDPGEYWDAIQRCTNSKGEHPDALYILAIFCHESTYGKFGAAATTKSWGNTRPPSFGALEIGQLPQTINGQLNGYFSIYATWLDGCISTATRLMTDQWVYANRTQIIQIYSDPSGKVWAPPGDYNDVSSYIGGVLNTMNAYQSNTPAPSGGVPKPAILTDRRAEPGHYDGYDASDGMPRVIEAIVCHISDGSEVGDLEQLTTVVSANYYINKQGVIRQLVSDDHCAWTNGPYGNPDLTNPLIAKWFANKWNPNTRTLSIEHEGKHGDLLTPAQLASSIALIGYLCWLYHLPVDRTHIIGHYQIDSISRSYCPSFTPDEWSAIVGGALALQPGSTPPAAPQTVQEVVVPGVGTFHIGGGFLQYYNTFGGLEIDGYPLTEEFQENGLTVQYFERSRYEWHPGQAPGKWDVMRGRVGAELLALKAAAK